MADLEFKVGNQVPSTDTFEYATDFWPVNHMLEMSDYDIMNVDLKNSNVRFEDSSNSNVINYDIEYFDLGNKQLSVWEETSSGKRIREFDPASIKFEDEQDPWELMACYSVFAEIEKGKEHVSVYSNQNNASNMQTRLEPYWEEGFLTELENSGFYQIGKDEHVGEKRGADVIREFDNFQTRLRKRGAIDYEVEVVQNQHVVAIEKGGYKFLTMFPEDAPYSNPAEALHYRYQRS